MDLRRRWLRGAPVAVALCLAAGLSADPGMAAGATPRGMAPPNAPAAIDPLPASDDPALPGVVRLLDSRPAAGLAVYTSPDPTPADSAAYVYSTAALSGAPEILVVGPRGDRYTVRARQVATDPSNPWWSAPLPHSVAGVYQVDVAALTTTGARVTGSSSFEVVGDTVTGRGPRWTAIGPGATGGILAVDPRDQRDLYAASGLAAEVFASTDAGRHWRMERTLPVAGGYPTALLALPGRHTRLVLAVNGGNGRYVDDPTYTGKLLTSTDGGAHWRDLGLPDSFVRTVTATPDGSTLMAVTDDGIEVTHDDGARWTRVDVPWKASDYSASSLVGDDLYVGTLSGLYVVRGIGGAGTTPAAPVLLFTPPGVPSAWIDGVTGDSGAVYATGPQGGIYVSHDAGATWADVRPAPAGLMSMFQDVDGTVYAAAKNTVLVGTHGGTDWAAWAEPVPAVDNQDVAVAGRTVYLGTWDAGFFSTGDQGATYQWLGGIPDVNAYGLAVAAGPGGGEVIAGTDSNIYRAGAAAAATGQPTVWGPPAPQVANGAVTPLVATAPDRSVVYKVRSGPRTGTYTVYASADAGATWQQRGPTSYGVPDALLVDPADPADLYVTGDSAIEGASMTASTDGGATWSTVALPAPITALAGDPRNPDRLWLGGAAGLWTSNDAGTTLTRLQRQPVSALTALPGNRLVVGGFGLSVSSDGGVTLRAAHLPGLDVSVSAIVGSSEQPRTVYAATTAFHDGGLLKGGHGVYRSTDGGLTWHAFSTGLTDRDVLSLAVSPDGRALYAGTLHGGVDAISLDGPSGR